MIVVHAFFSETCWQYVSSIFRICFHKFDMNVSFLYHKLIPKKWELIFKKVELGKNTTLKHCKEKTHNI